MPSRDHSPWAAHCSGGVSVTRRLDFTSYRKTPDASAGCPAWDRFLAETFPGDPAARDVLQEIFGYCLWPTCEYEKLFLLYGDAHTGKSTAAETLQAVLGADSVAALSLERLGGRFDLAGLVGKLANISFDASEIYRAAEGTLKALASGEPDHAEVAIAMAMAMRCRPGA